MSESAEFADIVALVNESRGIYLDNPSPIEGGSITFYITAKDGVRHYYNNNGNTNLMADGDHYESESGESFKTKLLAILLSR